MATKLQTILKQISKLQVQADSLRSQEKAGVVTRIREAIAHYDITADELYGEAKPKRAPAAKAARPQKQVRKAAKAAGGAKTAGVAKYGDGTGRTWSGVGKRPNWFKEAIAAGKAAEDLLIARS
jgi:DNA-binding protein H-NS